MNQRDDPSPEGLASLISDSSELTAVLTTLVAGAPVGLAFLDPRFRYLLVNRALAELNGRAIREHLDCTIYEIIPQEAHQVVPLLNRALAGEVVAGQELEASVPDERGQRRRVVVNYYPCRLPDGRVFGIGAVVSDITERVRAAEERARLEAAAATARLEGALLAARTVAHLINNHLALAVGFAELLADRPDLSDEERNFARQVRDGAQRAAETVARLQRIVRLEEIPLDTETVGSILDLDRSSPDRP